MSSVWESITHNLLGCERLRHTRFAGSVILNTGNLSVQPGSSSHLLLSLIVSPMVRSLQFAGVSNVAAVPPSWVAAPALT